MPEPKSNTNKTLIIGLSIFVVILVAFVLYLFSINQSLSSNFNNLNGEYNSLTGQYNGLSNQYNSISNQLNMLNGQYASLNSQYNSLNSQYNSLNSNYNQLDSNYNILSANYSQSLTENQILQGELSNATTLIEELQGPTGILPTYMDLAYIGPYYSGGAYWLNLIVKNTGTVNITEIFVSLDSQPIGINFNYLNATVSSASPLPPFQTATAYQDVSPPIGFPGTYTLVIQATASNGTLYTYQTTITSHT